jgi:tRNA threonylcarbamoyladenosine biosynthesis protein TsaB
MMMPPSAAIKVLALDTSTQRGSVALLQGRELMGELRIFSLQTHSSRLLRSIQFLLESVGWEQTDLELVAAGIGPGSFTGIRIGVATALGMAQSLSIPFVGISCLDVFANSAPLVSGRLGVIVDAQRSQVYYCEYEIKNGKTRARERPALWPPQALERRLKRRGLLYLVGDGAAGQFRALKVGGIEWPRILDVDPFLAAGIGRMALLKKRSWRSGDALTAEPLYIRPPDALRPRLGNR